MCGSYLAQNTTDFRVLDVLLDNWTDEMGLMNAKDTSNGFVIADILRKRLETVAWVSTFGKRNSVLPQLLYLIQREQIWDNKIPVVDKKLDLLIGYNLWHFNRCTRFKVHFLTMASC